MNKFARVSFRSRGAAVVALGAISGSAMADALTFEPATYVASIMGTIPGMLAVGGAVFAVMLAIKSTKWGRRAL